MGYLSIPNLYKDQDILLFKECYALEKVHGTSSHLGWNGKDIIFFAGNESHQRFTSLFDQEFLKTKFSEKIGLDSCFIYGEGYGGKQQGMSHTYGKFLKFIVFDVQINDCWLSVPNAEEVAKYLGLEFVHYVKIPTTLEAIDFERDADSIQAIRNGMGTGKMREGVVLRPLIEVIKNNGKRIICKHKRKEFSERLHVPKVDAEKLMILQEAQSIADEWVLPMRLEHVLQKIQATSIEHTPLVIKAMIADVYKEAKGEIVESKEVSTAIGKKTAALWRKKILK